MKVNIAAKLAQFDEQWSPRIVGELNGQEVKLARIEGAFEWHSHPDADELFLVVKGEMIIHLREEDVHLTEGEFYIVRRGVEHLPEAAEEAHILMFEPAGTLNTGNIVSERTVPDPEKI